MHSSIASAMVEDTLVTKLFPSNEALRGRVWRVRADWSLAGVLTAECGAEPLSRSLLSWLSLIRENIKQRPSPAQSEPESPSDASYLYIDIVLSGSAVSGAIGMEFGQKMWPIRGQCYRPLTSKRASEMRPECSVVNRDAPNYCPSIEECSIKERLP